MTPEEITLPRRARSAFFNYLSGVKPAVLVGTQNAAGVPNLAIFNSLIHIGAHPPLLGLLLRPRTVPRETYANLKATGFYTINHVTTTLIGAAHQTSAKYPAGESEFAATGLTVERTAHPAPYVQECRIKIGLQYREEYEIAANGTVLIVGEIVELLLPRGAFDETGFLRHEALDTTACSGLDSYYSVQFQQRLPYAKP